MFLKSLQWRLVSFFCLIAVCLIIPIGFVLNIKMEDYYYKNFVNGIEEGFKNNWSIPEGSRPKEDEILSVLKNSAGVFLIIGEYKSYTLANRLNNTVVHTSDPRYEKGQWNVVLFGELLESDNFIRAMAGRDGNEKKLEHYGNKEYFDYAKPIGDYVLYFRYYKDEWQPVLSDLNKMILTSLLTAFIVAFILGYVLSKTITVPIVRIMHKAHKISGGDFDQVLEVKSDDEIGKLTSTFNYMAQSLKDTLVAISNEKNKIETILNYMTDGVIAFNLNEEVIHANPAAKKMLGKEVLSETFTAYAQRYGLDFGMDDILNLEVFTTREVTLHVADKVVRVNFAVFTDEGKKPGGIIAVLQDITEQHKLENMRKEFVANVSHELRTPLTSIKSYTETLLDGVLDDRETTERFLNVIDSEADRMTRLVKDLLQLTRLDNQQMQWNMKDISFEEVVRGSVEKMKLEAMNKEQTIECFAIGESPRVRADRDRMEQVVLNIISNAIKYTPGGGKITVYVGKTQSEAYAKIADTGIGIPEQDLPRLFERFYRVDKARSREMGGTGLGLAIAKEIVEAHSGTITIASELGKGTEVTVKLPCSV